MKKLIVALLVVGLVASVASADVVKLFKMSSATTVYIGSPRSNLPATAYVAIDENGWGYCVFYWTQGGVKYMSDVWEYYVYWYGSLLNLQDNYTWVYQDIYAADGVTLLLEKYADWDMCGRGTGVGLIPSSFGGVCYSEVYDSVASEYLGWGLGTSRATAYKTLNGATDNAFDVINAVASDLQGAGYTILGGLSALYQ